MKKVMSMQIIVSVAILCFAGVYAHTDEEFLDKARDMIGTLQASDWETEEELQEHQISNDPIYQLNYMSQDDYFAFFATNGWSRADCETAFDRYLSWVSTNDMSVVDSQERGFARGAMSQCEAMKYAKALGTLRAYARNPTAIDRLDVIDMAVRFGDIDESSASFMEEIVTNNTLFTYADIRWAIPSYCHKLLAINTNDTEVVAIRNRGARLFYANRLEWKDASALDDVFVAALPGYAFSSNRLEYANHVLSWTTNNDWRAMRDHFVAITNLLLQSGHPLNVISVGEP